MTRPADYLQVYLVTDRKLALGRSLEEVVSVAVDGGVTAVQIREKDISTRAFLEEAQHIRDLLSKTGVPLFVNDRLDVAIAAQADGVHVGQEDIPAAAARQMIGPEMLLGVSVATRAETRQALSDGADYVSVSPVFLTPTKPDADRAVGLEGVKRVREAAGDAPVLAIGGIDARNAASIVLAGADGVSVVSAIMSAQDPAASAAKIRNEVVDALDRRRELR